MSTANSEHSDYYDKNPNYLLFFLSFWRKLSIKEGSFQLLLLGALY